MLYADIRVEKINKPKKSLKANMVVEMKVYIFLTTSEFIDLKSN